jgi:hypothetical protein
VTAAEPRAARVCADGRVEVTFDGGSAIVGRHERAEGWTLMAVLGSAAVLETVGADVGAILAVGPEGVRRRWPTSLAWTGRDQGTQPPRADVLPGTPDVLRAWLLAGDDDPDPSAVFRAVPPIRRLADGEGERPHTFVGSPDCSDVVPVYYDSLRATTRVNPVVVAPEAREAIERQVLGEGLVGGWLPVVRVVYPVADGSRWEQVLFATPHGRRDRSQPVWYRFCRVGPDGALRAVRYVDTYLPYPVGDEPPAEAFYAALGELEDFWVDRARLGVEVELPEPWLVDFVRHSFVREMITRTGDEPRYGVVDRVYGAPEHDGFQDVLTSAMAAYLAWGRPDVAGRYADQYLHDVVRPDGSLDYRGPEVGQYGRMLSVLAEHARQTGDRALLRRHDTKVQAVVGILLDRRRRALRLPHGDPARGLIAGRHEADISFDTPSLGQYDYERPYLSNSAEAWRGLRDLGRTWQAMGADDGDAVRAALGRRLIEVSDGLRQDLLRAIDESWLERPSGRVLPIIAGAQRTHLDAPYRSRPESFDDNRVWHELLGSGALPGEVVREIVEGGAARGDTALGIFGNRKHAVAFTAHGVAYGLLQHDLVREFLLLLWAHIAHMHTRGTWTAVECSDLDRDRGEHWPYCAPAQMTVPLLVRWMLVFEDPLAPRVWLARGLPRDWLRHGRTVAVRNAPTGHGPVSYRIDSRVAEGTVVADVDECPPTAEVLLRLRLPLGAVMRRARVDGQDVRVDAHRQEVTLPPGTSSAHVEVDVT